MPSEPSQCQPDVRDTRDHFLARGFAPERPGAEGLLERWLVPPEPILLEAQPPESVGELSRMAPRPPDRHGLLVQLDCLRELSFQRAERAEEGERDRLQLLVSE